MKVVEVESLKAWSCVAVSRQWISTCTVACLKFIDRNILLRCDKPFNAEFWRSGVMSKSQHRVVVLVAIGVICYQYDENIPLVL